MNGARVGAELALPAWYGKLPGAGDFVGRRMPGALARTWEQWLSQGMAAGHASFDAHAPVWSFAIPAGSGDGWVQLGCVAPSHDRVGRHYPLVVAQPIATAGYARDGGHAGHGGQGGQGEHAGSALAGADVRIRLMSAIVREAIRSALGPEDFDLALAQGFQDDPARSGGAGGWPNLWEYFDPNGMTSFWWTDAGDGAPRTDVHTGGLDAALFWRLFGEPGGGPT